MPVKVAVNGYGNIGKPVADAVAKQDGIVTSQMRDEATESLEMMIPALSPDEVANLLGMAKKSTLPQAFQNITTLAQRLI